MSAEVFIYAIAGSRDWIDYATLIATAAGVIIVGIYTAVTYWQARLTSQALAETRKSNEHTAESNRIQREAMVAANRARVGISAMQQQIASGPALVRVMLRNSGASPATNIVGKSGHGIYTQPLSEFPPIAPPGALPSIAVLSAEAETWTEIGGGEPHITSKDLQDLSQGACFLYFFAVFTYEDGFGNSRETSCCIYWRKESDTLDYAPFGNRVT